MKLSRIKQGEFRNLERWSCCPPVSLVRVNSVTLVQLVECDQLCDNKQLLLHPKPEALCVLLKDTTCKYSHHTDF